MKTTVKITFIAFVLASIIATSCNKPILNTPIEKILEDGTWELTEHIVTPNILWGTAEVGDANYLNFVDFDGDGEETIKEYSFSGRYVYRLKENDSGEIDSVFETRYSIEYKGNKAIKYWRTSPSYLERYDSIDFEIKSYKKNKIELIHQGDSILFYQPCDTCEYSGNYVFEPYEIRMTYKKK